MLSGIKQTRKNDQVIKTTNYIGNFVYENGELVYILTSEGRIVPEEGKMVYQYFMKDHLGNNRMMFDEYNRIIQQSSYYPFGMLFTDQGQPRAEYDINRYLYNGKELQDDFDLDWYDYGARYYDAQLGRWHVIDNKAEKYYFTSPYTYAINNPISVIDPDGNDIVVLNNSKGAQVAGKSFGHMAVLIGNDNDGWTYVSKDGRADSNGDGNKDGTMLTGGKSTRTIKPFDTLEEAMSSDVVRKYDQGFQIETSAEQDATATSTAKESAESDYHVITSNCADVATDALESTGNNGGTDQVMVAPGEVVTEKPITPNARYDKIVKNNEGGKEIEMPIKKDEQQQ